MTLHTQQQQQQNQQQKKHEEILYLSIAEIKEKEEYRSLLPVLLAEDYKKLFEDIAKRGIQIPLLLNSNRELLDGYTRLKIARELQIQQVPCMIKSFSNELEEKEFVLVINACRRHMNTAQKVEVAVKLLEIEKEKARIRQLSGLKYVGTNHITTNDIASVIVPTPWEGTMIDTHQQQQQQQQQDKDKTDINTGTELKTKSRDKKKRYRANETVKKVAKKVGISGKSLWKGLEIKEKAKTDAYIAGLWSKALQGGVSLAHVYSELKKKEQHEKLLNSLNSNSNSNNGNNNNNNNNGNNSCCSNSSNSGNSSSGSSSSSITKKHNVILADPPWQYEFGLRGNAAQHYPCLTLEEIASVFKEHEQRGEIANNAILFLWSTAPKLKEALKLMDMLGFEYKTNIVWIKDKIATGYYVRNKHELLLIGVRGDMPLPLEHNRPESVIIAERREHSRKPKIVYEVIEKMYPNCSYLELFARERREGWEAYGLDLA